MQFSVSDPAVRRFTVSELHRMDDAGVFKSDERVELLEGIVFSMVPLDRPHAALVERVAEGLHRALGGPVGRCP
jgi:hypothetical protein